tara:strand:- start:122 stop:886 length:765 start_codon:yes stop_codon:yes gene_type:complete
MTSLNSIKPGDSPGDNSLLARTQALLQNTLTSFEPGRIALSFSGAEDVVLIDLVHKLGLQVDVFSLDTGRLHEETYQFLETVREHYRQPIELVYPEPHGVQALVKDKGLFSFYRDGHGECCEVRKVAPLRRKLAGLDAWITGQRQDQSVTRGSVPLREEDTVFGSACAGSGHGALIKFNPLSEWSSADVWQYMREQQVPYNPLHDQGYVSIGCQPCTRSVGPFEHERAGRWWWEEATKKECGLHRQNIIAAVQA